MLVKVFWRCLSWPFILPHFVFSCYGSIVINLGALACGWSLICFAYSTLQRAFPLQCLICLKSYCQLHCMSINWKHHWILWTLTTWILLFIYLVFCKIWKGGYGTVLSSTFPFFIPSKIIKVTYANYLHSYFDNVKF